MSGGKTDSLGKERQSFLVHCVRRFYVTHLSHKIWAPREVEAHELRDLSPVNRVLAHVHEQRPRERRVRPVQDRLAGRLYAAAAAIDSEQLQLVRVLLVVGEAEVAERPLVAGDALDQDVVVLARRVVGAAGPLFTDDLIGEVVKRARVRPRSVELYPLVGEPGA